jgi:DNA polymerase/3'-5' exonuclease PolX
MAFKVKFPRADAIAVAKELCDALRPVTERLIVAGSLRRRKPMVGDVEILFVPKMQSVKTGLFEGDQELMNHAEAVIECLVDKGIILRRINVKGAETWGQKNKLAFHAKSCFPVDLFSATDANWFNYLVCRTGSAEHNTKIAMAAQARGWKWNPYGEGFTDERGQLVRVSSEKDVFTYLDLPYLEPWERL